MVTEADRSELERKVAAVRRLAEGQVSGQLSSDIHTVCNLAGVGIDGYLGVAPRRDTSALSESLACAVKVSVDVIAALGDQLDRQSARVLELSKSKTAA